MDAPARAQVQLGAVRDHAAEEGRRNTKLSLLGRVHIRRSALCSTRSTMHRWSEVAPKLYP